MYNNTFGLTGLCVRIKELHKCVSCLQEMRLELLDGFILDQAWYILIRYIYYSSVLICLLDHVETNNGYQNQIYNN